MIYIVYPVLLIVLFWGCRIYGRGKWNDEFLSLQQTKAFLGFAALLIMFHHVGQKTSASWIDRKYYIPGLEFFVPIGYILVAVFTFCSGYGLYKSFKSKPDYLGHGFMKRHVLTFIVLGYLVAWLFLVVRLCLHEPMGDGRWLYYLLGLKLSNPNAWYVIVMPFFYLSFFVAFRYIKNEKKAFIAVAVFMFAYQLLGTAINHNDWWMRGEWWYNSIHLFPAGIFLAMHEGSIVKHLKKRYVLYMIIGAVVLVLTYFGKMFIQSRFSYYEEYLFLPLKMLRRLVCLSSEVVFSSLVVFYVFLIGMKIHIGNRFLMLMGDITLEFYLIHGLYVELFSYSFDGKAEPLYYMKNSLLFLIIVFALALPSALLLKYVRRKLLVIK